MQRSIALAVFTASLLAVQAAPSLASDHLMTLTDLRREVGISDPKFTPDGRAIVFIKTSYDFETNDVNTDLDEVDIRTRATHTMTSTMDDVSSPRFSPDGTQIAFLADGLSRIGGDTSQIFVMPAGGGTPKQITHAAQGVDSYAWRPDGGAMAFVTADKAKNAIAFVVGDNDYLSTSAPQPWHLWIVPAQGGTPRRLTSGSKGLPPGEIILPQSVPEAWFSWSTDGKTIAYTQMPNAYKTDGVLTKITLVDVATGHQHPLTSHAGEEAGGEYSPDGSRIMYWYPRNGDEVAFNDLFITSARGGISPASVAAREEGREGTGDGGHDEDRPELEDDVDDLAAARQRILERRRDGQDLDGREEQRIPEPVDVAPLDTALERPHDERPCRVDSDRQEECDRDPRKQAPVSLAPGQHASEFIDEHLAPFAMPVREPSSTRSRCSRRRRRRARRSPER